MISLAAPDGISPHDFVSRRINDRENVLILKIYIHLASNRIVLRHACFAIEMQGLDDFVLGHVNHCFCFASLIGNIEFMKRGGVSAAVRLGVGWNLLDYL